MRGALADYASAVVYAAVATSAPIRFFFFFFSHAPTATPKTVRMPKNFLYDVRLYSSSYRLSFYPFSYIYIFRLATGGWEGVLNYLRKLPGWSNGTHHIVADNFVDGHWGDQYCSHMNPMCTKHVRQEQQLSLSLFCFVHFQSSND